MTPLTLIGIDCATDPRKVGLACGTIEADRLSVRHACRGTADNARTIVDWIDESEWSLLALDAPLGWPRALSRALSGHQAGRPVGGDPNLLFRRITDRIIESEIGKRPLDVGADRIARTAHAALALLQQVRALAGAAIPLAWSPNTAARIAAIEVYPAATLTACGLRSSGYKRPEQKGERREILKGLKRQLTLPAAARRSARSNADVLDAVICCLAAADFVRGDVVQPFDIELSRSEGWIWARRPTNR